MGLQEYIGMVYLLRISNIYIIDSLFYYFDFSFQPGEIVIEYVGEMITNKVADYREKEYNLRGFGDCYMFRVDTQTIVYFSFIYIILLFRLMQLSLVI